MEHRNENEIPEMMEHLQPPTEARIAAMQGLRAMEAEIRATLREHGKEEAFLAYDEARGQLAMDELVEAYRLGKSRCLEALAEGDELEDIEDVMMAATAATNDEVNAGMDAALLKLEGVPGGAEALHRLIDAIDLQAADVRHAVAMAHRRHGARETARLLLAHGR